MLAEPATKAAPMSEQRAATASDFFRPIQSAMKPCIMAPMAKPALNNALMAPRMLVKMCVSKQSTEEPEETHFAVYALAASEEVSIIAKDWSKQLTVKVKIDIEAWLPNAGYENRETKAISEATQTNDQGDENIQSPCAEHGVCYSNFGV